MGSFLKHPKFWLPIVVLLAIELAFRWGVWEPLAEPSSYSGTGIQVKRAAAEYGPERITAITVGDSRTRFGFLHPEILERSEAAGGAHVSLAMPGSNRATITVVTAWAMREFPNLEQVVVGVPVNTLFEENNGYYEIGNIEPFRTMADTVWLAQYLPPLKGDPDSLGILSSLMSYRRSCQPGDAR